VRYRSCNVYITVITIRMTDGVMCSIMERNDTPSVLLNWLRSQCVPIGVKRLKVLATCRELWVSGKPSSQSARGVGIPPITRLASSGYLVRRVGIRVARETRNTGFVVALQTYVSVHTDRGTSC
jgi:hypothetical protein